MLTLSPPSEKLRLSELAPQFAQSEIRAMNVACAAAGGLNFAQGVCDTDPPHPVVEGAIHAIQAGHNIYTRMEGVAALREGISAKLAIWNGIQADPETELLVTNGATGAMYCALLALLNPGDEVLVLEPFYGYHLLTLRSQKLVPVTVPLMGPEYILDMDRLEAAVTSKTRAIILNTPGNPSGKVFTREELEALAAFSERHDLFVLTDEMYEYFLYDGAEHISIATMPGMAKRTITMSGFSKTFSVTGWRLGYLTAHRKWIPSIANFHDLTYICAPAPLQHGAAAGLLALPQSFYNNMAAEYQTKRDLICTALSTAGLTPSVPRGAYYVLADASNVRGEDAKAKALTVLAETGIATVAGSAFYATGPDGTNRGDHLLRVCFAKKDAEIREACHRLTAYRPQ